MEVEVLEMALLVETLTWWALKGVRIQEDLMLRVMPGIGSTEEGSRFAPESEWALKQLKDFYGKEEHTVILTESRITRAIFSCGRADG